MPVGPAASPRFLSSQNSTGSPSRTPRPSHAKHRWPTPKSLDRWFTRLRESRQTGVRAWVKQAEIDEKRDPHGPMTTDEKAGVARLRRELKTVTMERDFLRKAAAFVCHERMR
jgi:transposase-like protein